MVENGKIFVIFLTFSSRNHRDHTFLLMIRNLEFGIPPARRELGSLKWFENHRIDHFHAGLPEGLTDLLLIS